MPVSLTEKHHLSTFQFFGNLMKHCRGLYDTQSQKTVLKVLKVEMQWLKPMLIKNIFQISYCGYDLFCYN